MNAPLQNRQHHEKFMKGAIAMVGQTNNIHLEWKQPTCRQGLKMITSPHDPPTALSILTNPRADPSRTGRGGFDHRRDPGRLRFRLQGRDHRKGHERYQQIIERKQK